MHLTVEKIADLVGGEVKGDKEDVITKPAKIEEAIEGSITFVAQEKYIPYINISKASAYLVAKSFDCSPYGDKNFILVDNVYNAVSTLLGIFDSNENKVGEIHQTATISVNATLGENVSIGAQAVVEDGAIIGNGSVIGANAFIGRNSIIGSNCMIHPGVSIYHESKIGSRVIIHSNSVIGSDGFGFALQEDGSYKKIPQVGIVIIEDEVEIGASCTIDRASMGQTKICKGAKLDNLIHIAHNVVIGENTVIAAQVGIAGSTKIGANCMIGGQAGIVGHLNIADGTIFQAKSGMTKSVKKTGTKWYGYPAIEYNNYLRSFAIFKNLDKLIDRVKQLEFKMKDIDKQH